MAKVKVTRVLAVDDSYVTEDFLNFDLENIGDYLQIWIADLLANDKGGGGIAFVSADGEASDGTAIIYDQSNGFLNLDAAAYKALAENETVQVSFKYTIRLGNGSLSEATVTFEVTGENDAPEATSGWASGDEDTLISGSVLATDVDGDTLTYALVQGAQDANGNAVTGLTFNPDGTYTFQGPPEFAGTVTFTYKANDGRLDSNVEMVTLTINPVNDAPVAGNDSFTIFEDVTAVSHFGKAQPFDLPSDAPRHRPVNGNILLNDSDVDEEFDFQVVLVDGPSNSLYFHLDSFGQFYYVPLTNYNGTDSFSYKLIDSEGAESNVATVTLNITPSNDPPDTIADTYTLDEDTTITVSAAEGVLANDSDVEGDSFTAVLGTGPAHGSLTLNADGSFSYTPDADWSGSDSFTYKAVDSQGVESGLETVTLNITPVNDAPVFQITGGETSATKLFIAENTAGTFTTVVATDVDGPVTYSIGPNPTAFYDNRFFTIDPNTGELRFTSPPDFEFVDPGDDDHYLVQVTASDSDGGVAARDVWVQLTSVIDEQLIVDFEDRQNIGGELRDGYQGFKWDVPRSLSDSDRNLNTLNGDTYPDQNTGYVNAGTGVVAFTPSGAEPVSISRSLGGDFVFDKVQLTSATDPWMTVQVRGYNNNSLVGSLDVTITNEGPTWVDPDWGEIDFLQFDVIASATFATPLVLDNFYFQV